MTEQQQRLHWVLDYGGHAIGVLLLVYGGWLWLFGRWKEAEFGLTLILWAICIWSATRLAMYIMSGQIPFVTKRSAQKKVFAIVRSPWVWGSTLALVAVWALVVIAAESGMSPDSIARSMARSVGHILGMVAITALVGAGMWSTKRSHLPQYDVRLITTQGDRTVPFKDVLRFARHRSNGDATIATLYLKNGEAVTGQAMEGVLQLLSKTAQATSDPK